MLKKKIILFFLIILAFVSVVYAFNIAITYGSSDFQYSPSILFIEKINPYKYYLYNDYSDGIIGAQYPIYSHATYVLFSVFKYFSWEITKIIWACINIIFSVLIIKIIISKVKLDKYSAILIASIFFMSTPFRNCLSNGQHTFLILIAYCGIFFSNNYIRNFTLGISYIKYSFMPILSFFIFFRDGIKGFIISGLFCTFGWVLFSYYLDENLFSTIFQPVESGLKGFDTTLARGDLYTILNYFGNIFLFSQTKLFTIIIILLVSLFFGKQISKIKDPVLIFSLLMIVNLFTFGHLIYDYIVLLPIFIYSIKKINFLNAKLSLIIVLYFWFGIRIFEYAKIYYFTSMSLAPGILENFINFFMLVFLYFVNLNNKDYGNVQ